ncbi:hypothetical protein HETIRDRAFT_247006, partial [Heterobasidion irregulare TC 32-1]
KNIWVAAGDGDLARVQLMSHPIVIAISPNAPDPYTYTPMHAAASYGQLHVLDYLISRGGDVNTTDDDGDTPLYTVENVETARYLVEHGATVDRRNNEGIQPAEHLAEDFPEVASYLAALAPAPAPHATDASGTPSPASPAPALALAPGAARGLAQPSQHSQDAVSEYLTASLLQSVQDIMGRAEAEGRDPDEELRQVVGRTVLEGVVAGYGMSETAAD